MRRTSSKCLVWLVQVSEYHQILPSNWNMMTLRTSRSTQWLDSSSCLWTNLPLVCCKRAYKKSETSRLTWVKLIRLNLMNTSRVIRVIMLELKSNSLIYVMMSWTSWVILTKSATFNLEDTSMELPPPSTNWLVPDMVISALSSGKSSQWKRDKNSPREWSLTLTTAKSEIVSDIVYNES